MSLDLKITIPGHCISANALYKHNRSGGIYLSDDAKAYRAMAKSHVEKAMKTGGTYGGGEVVVRVESFDNYYTKAGLIRDVDIDNSVKNLLDSIFPVLGVRDKVVFDLHVKKKQFVGDPKCVIVIKERA